MSTLIVIAKAPVAGAVKTRLTPALSPADAARLAEAALADTLHTVARCGAARRVIALHGAPGDWLPPGFEVIAQRGEGLAARLAAAFDDVADHAFVIAMDTPQVTADALDEALEHPCAIGPADDGGYWGLGLPGPDARVFRDVPMSAPDTGAAQVKRLRALGYAPRRLAALRDMDTIADAQAIAGDVPGSRVAATLRSLEGTVAVEDGSRVGRSARSLAVR